MAQALATTDRYLDGFRALQPEGEPGWLRELRERALARFGELGFPTARRGNEPWKYTNVAPIARAEFAYAAGPAPDVTLDDLKRAAPWDDAWSRLVFVDGRYAPPLSAPPDGVEVRSLAEALRETPSLLERRLARHAPFDDEAFTALNTAFLRDGAFVHLADGASLEAPLHLVFASARERAVTYPRTLVVAGPSSRAAIIESYVSLTPGPRFSDAVTEIELGDGAALDHYRLMLEDAASFHVGVSRVYQGPNSAYSSTSFQMGNALGRADLRVTLDAPGGTCHLNGLYITKDEQHLDNFINIDHAKPECLSRLLYKGILDDRSRAVFGGTVFVRPGAVKTDAHQEDKNLILSDEAEVDSKPSLEIYADDVKCGHGATAGTVTEDALFYMQSRGLDPETATELLIKGFAAQVLDRVRVDSLRTHLESLTAEALRGVTLGLSR
jgi:Fe-S cluster assembly protein SufD